MSDLTEPQYKALRNLKRGLPSDADLEGPAQYGGHRSVIMALRRKGYTDIDPDGDVLTEEGSEALARHEQARDEQINTVVRKVLDRLHGSR